MPDHDTPPIPTPAPGTPLTVSHLLLEAKQREIDAVRRMAARAELAEVIGQLVHALQRERGASSVFLASHGQRFSDIRAQSAAMAEPIALHLRSLFAAQLAPQQMASARMLSLMAWAQLGLDALADLRAQIASQSLSAHDAVAAFSRLIAGLIELVFHVADAAVLPSVSRLLVALLHLVQAQEEAGQERALGALLYASGLCDEAHQQRLIHLIDAQEHSLQVFADFADPALRTRWEQQQTTPGTARLERLRRTLCAAKPGAPLDSNLSDAWFDVSSDRIGELWQLEMALVQGLREDCAAQIRLALQDLEDSEGLLRRLRDNPPAHSHAVDRFFDTAQPAGSVPGLARAPGQGSMDGGEETASLLQALHSQSARLASMEAELGAARRALHERKVIERAKGVLMARLGMSEESAFRALQKTSMDQNRRLLDVAEATLALPDFAFGQAAPAPAPAASAPPAPAPAPDRKPDGSRARAAR